MAGQVLVKVSNSPNVNLPNFRALKLNLGLLQACLPIRRGMTSPLSHGRAYGDVHGFFANFTYFSIPNQ